MIAELLVLQQLLDKTGMVTPPESNTSTTATSTTRSKAETAYNAYKDRVTSYLERFKYRR
tara:strand:- start:26 stop:205 length:180 start_codon:yes stop_codon:yes gene_type:complete